MSKKKAALELWQTGQYEEACTLLVTAIDEEPDDMDNYYQLGAFLTISHQYEEAEKFLRGGLAKQPNHFFLQFGLGNLFYETGNYQEAITIFQKLSFQAETDQDNFDSQMMLAQSYQGLGELAKASVYGLTAYQMKPKDLSANLFMGQMMLAQGYFSEAKTYFEQAIQLDNQSWQGYFDLAVTEMALKNDEQLIHEYFKKSQELDNASFQKRLEKLSDIEQYIQLNDQ